MPIFVGNKGPAGLGGVNSTTTDSVNGKIGTDTEMADVSLYDMLVALDGVVDAVQTDLGDPSARTNLQTIVALLGNPDTANCSIWNNLGAFRTQTNLTSLLAVLGVPDTAGKGLYTCLITDRLDDANFGLSALHTHVAAGATAADLTLLMADVGDASGSTLTSIYGILGNPATTITAQIAALDTLIDTVHTDVDAVLADVGDASGSTLTSIYGILGNPATTFTAQITANRTALETASLAAGAGSVASNAREGSLIRYTADTAKTVMDSIGTISNTTLADTLAATLGDFVATDMATRLTNIQTALEGGTTTVNRVAGVTQILKVAVTCASDAAPVTLATATTKACIIKGITVHNVAGANADLTSLNVKGGASSAIVFIDDVTGLKANLNAADKQVWWTGIVRLPVAATITVDPTGTGATALDMVLTIEYYAEENTGYLA